MTVIFEPKDLKSALAHILNVVPARTSLPIWGAVRITADDRGVHLTAKQAPDHYIEVKVAGTIEAPLDVAVNARDLAKLVGKGRIQLTATASGLQVQCEGATSTLPTFPIHDLPEWPVFADTQRLVNLRADTLSAHLQAMLTCVSTEDTRFYLEGAALQSDKNGRVTLCATDGHKLTRRVLVHARSAEFKPYSHIIRTEALKAIVAMCKADPDGMVSLTHSTDNASILHNNLIVARAANVTLRTRAIDGTFPDWTRVVPQADLCQRVMTVDRAALAAFAKNAKAMKAPYVVIRKSPSDTMVRLTANMDEQSTEANIDGSYMSDCSLAFDSGYLVQVLGLFADKMVHFHSLPPTKSAKDPQAYLGNPVAVTDNAVWHGEPSDQELVVLIPIRHTL